MELIQHDTTFEGIPVRYWEAGNAASPPLLLLHGSGPGAATHGNWRLVLGPLAEHFHVIAGDLIGFGQSGRKPAPPYFDYPLWSRQSAFLLGLFGRDQVNVIGHSLSGALALKLAGADKRVRRVLTTGSIGAGIRANEETILVWTFPKTEDDLVRAGHALVYDRSLIDATYVAGRKKILYEGDYEAYFGEMFAGDKQAYLDAVVLTDAECAAVTCPVLLVHGRDDRPTPIESSFELARRIPHADLVQLARCGHSVALEHPRKLVGLARWFFA